MQVTSAGHVIPHNVENYSLFNGQVSIHGFTLKTAGRTHFQLVIPSRVTYSVTNSCTIIFQNTCKHSLVFVSYAWAGQHIDITFQLCVRPSVCLSVYLSICRFIMPFRGPALTNEMALCSPWNMLVVFWTPHFDLVLRASFEHTNNRLG